jgi:putative Ca2+/H+ antiporter (TMEM165/GDT1 family)
MSTGMVALVSAFGLVLAVELPDKTLVATLVLTTRFRAWPVFAGVCVAFAVQCVIAVLFGKALTLLPDALVTTIVATLFGVGAFMLLREGFSTGVDGEEDASRSGPSPVTFLRSAVTSFGVLFAAEWGDASQLASTTRSRSASALSSRSSPSPDSRCSSARRSAAGSARSSSSAPPGSSSPGSRCSRWRSSSSEGHLHSTRRQCQEPTLAAGVHSSRPQRTRSAIFVHFIPLCPDT